MVTFKKFLSGESTISENTVEERREFIQKINKIILPRISVLTLPKQTVSEVIQIIKNFAVSSGSDEFCNEIIDKAVKSYLRHPSDSVEDKIREIPVFNYQPPVFNKEPIIFALKRLKFIADEIEKRKAGLSEGKDLQILTEFGSREIVISRISVVSNNDFEIKGLDNEGFVTIIKPYSILSLLFREVDEIKMMRT